MLAQPLVSIRTIAGGDMLPAKLGECYYDHFEEYLGRRVDHGKFTQDSQSPAIQILVYDGVYDGCRAFCSFRLVHYHRDLGGIGEVMCAVDEGWEHVKRVLANALFFMVQNRIDLGRGSRVGGIRNVSPEFVEMYGKEVLYLTVPYNVPEGFDRVECGDVVGHIYLAIFITEKERAYLDQHGVEAFEDLLEAQQVDPFHLRRPSCV